MMKKQYSDVRISIRTKINLMVIIVTILCTSSIGFVSYFISRQEMNKQGEILLKNAVKMAIQLIDSKQKEVERGSIKLEDAQEQVKEYLLGKRNADGTRPINKNIDLGKSGYFIVYDKNGLEVAHPSIEGQNVWDVQDKSGSGFYLVRDQIQKALNGGGFTVYSWTLPNSKRVAPKITYSEAEPNWGWIVAAGSYLEDYNKGSNSILKTLFITLVIALIICTVITMIFARFITRPILDITAALRSVGEGNFNMAKINAGTKDETAVLCNSFNKMIDNVGSAIRAVHSSADSVGRSAQSLSTAIGETSAATNEISQTISDVSESTYQQSKDISDETQKIQKLAVGIGKVTDITRDMEEDASDTHKLSNKGLEIVHRLIDRTVESTEATDKVNDVIVKMDKSSSEIGTIVETISGIAEQTNLLALNAAIEAARAGEQGKGFAVVADEVRKLAEQSSVATREIQQIISGIQSYSNMAVSAVDRSKAIVAEQEKAVNETKDIFGKIVDSINKTIDKINVLKGYSDNMSNEKDSIVDSIANISAISQENAAAAQEVSAATEKMAASASEMNKLTDELIHLASLLNESIKQFKI
ncbi:MAG: methyl-accepting chemotaxis protein [Bacillota bacterium]